MSQIVIVNVGGQYCHLIARRIRDVGVSATICTPAEALERLAGAKGVVISGGPQSVYAANAPKFPADIFQAALPVLGICYGHQLIAHAFGGRVRPGKQREYGQASLQIVGHDTILSEIPSGDVVWMSHGDEVDELPPGFDLLASTDDCRVAAMADTRRKLFGVQFHPEVTHSRRGQQVIENFIFRACRCERDWDARAQLPTVLSKIRESVGQRNVLFFVSGGVDSTVAFALCTQALGRERVRGLFVDTGFLRQGEREDVETEIAARGWNNFETVDAQRRFADALGSTVDPEEKRRRIGDTFLGIQREVLSGSTFASGDWILGQGTIYPDTIESGGGGSAATIKTHHNRVPEIEELEARGLIIEPIRDFYKDEVRALGRELGLPARLIDKHPFPGPGLAVRCLGSEDDFTVEADGDVEELARERGFRAWLVPLRSVGVQGDGRTYEKLTVLFGGLSLEAARAAAGAITRSCRHTNRVALLVGSSCEEGKVPSVYRAHLSPERVELLRTADAIVTKMMSDHGLTASVWQCPVVLVPVCFGSGETVALRPIQSTDGMTAEVVLWPESFVVALTRTLLALRGVDAVIYDVTNKPPATIEWE